MPTADTMTSAESPRSPTNLAHSTGGDGTSDMVDATTDVDAKMKYDQSGLQNVTSASAAVLGAAVTASHYANGHEKTVNFAGLYVVHGPTQSRHVRYMMEISVPEWDLRFRTVQRFRGFFELRKRLLKLLKDCHGQQRRYSQVSDVSPGKELLHMIAERATSPCNGCASTRKLLAAMKFPKRKYVFTNQQDIHERSLMLETFLSYCVELLLHWPGCKRGHMAWAVTLGKFLDVNLPASLRAHIALQRQHSELSEHSAGADNTKAPRQQAEHNDVPLLLRPHNASEIESDYGRNTEPTFSFISIDSSMPPGSNRDDRRSGVSV